MRRSIWIAAGVVAVAAMGSQLAVSKSEYDDAKERCRAVRGVLVKAEQAYACLNPSALLRF